MNLFVCFGVFINLAGALFLGFLSGEFVCTSFEENFCTVFLIGFFGEFKIVLVQLFKETCNILLSLFD